MYIATKYEFLKLCEILFIIVCQYVLNTVFFILLLVFYGKPSLFSIKYRKIHDLILNFTNSSSYLIFI